MRRRTSWLSIAALLGMAIVSIAFVAQAAVRPTTSADITRGRYLVAYGGCNECHTQGWAESDGTVPVSRWLTGSAIGFRGPWGTIYPTNIRVRFQEVSENQWLFMIHTRGGHPPMKWTDLRVLSLADQRAIYRFVRSLGRAGAPAPHDVSPGGTPTTPYYNVIPELPSKT